MSRAFRRVAPQTGKPGGVASRFLRADFREGDFDALIETKGPRLAWSRATTCPCARINARTMQPDPNCPSCNGYGRTFFRPTAYNPNDPNVGLGTLDAEQLATVERAKAVIIRGVLAGIEENPDMFRVLGDWALGSALLTVRGQNVLGYFDRIIHLDQVMAFTERFEADGSQAFPTRYSVVALNDVRSLTTIFGEADLKLTAGVVTWKAGRAPAAGTPIAVHYLCHPMWIVVQLPHLHRSALAEFKVPVSKRQTPEGNLQVLPMQVLIRLEWLEQAERQEG